VTEQATVFFPTSTATTTVDDEQSWIDTTHLRRAVRRTGAATPDPRKESDGSLLTPPEVFVKVY